MIKTVEYFLLVLVICSLGLIIFELFAYRRRMKDQYTRTFARGRLLRRSGGILMLITAIASILIGELKPAKAISWWSIALICVMGVFIIAVLDLKQTIKEIISQQRRIISTALQAHNLQNRNEKNEQNRPTDKSIGS